MQKRILVLGLVVLLLGFFGGYFSGVKWPGQFWGSQRQTETIISDLKGSSLLRSANLAVAGEVVSISSPKLTLKEGEDEFVFSVKEGATVLRLPGAPTGQEAASPIEIKFDEIKVGDRANLTFSLSVEGEFEVTHVAVFSEP